MILRPYVKVLGVPWFYSKKEVEIPKVRKVTKGHNWTEEQDEAIARLYPDTDTNEISKHLGITAKQIRRRAHFLGVEKTQEYLHRKQRNAAQKWGIIK